jgi:hypothetical protein
MNGGTTRRLEAVTINLYCQENLSEHLGIITANVEGIEPEDTGAPRP